MEKTTENQNHQAGSRAAADNATQRKEGIDSAPEFIDNRPETAAQRKMIDMMRNSPQVKAAAQMKAEPAQRKENKTGMPDNLKSGLENLSGMSMDHVNVHYNSPEPAQLNAHAFTQGSDIHVASGQEKHLPHEGWHVAQQAEGRVQPTMQMAGTQINDDVGLETEADVMGGEAMTVGQRLEERGQKFKPDALGQSFVSQRKIKFEDDEVTYDEKSLMTFFSKYFSVAGLSDKFSHVQALIVDEKVVHNYANIAALMDTFGPIEVRKKKAPVIVTKNMLLGDKVASPFESHNFNEKGGGVAPFLHTVWVGGAIPAAVRERLAEWSQARKVQVVLWMDKKAMQQSTLKASNENLGGITICATLAIGDTGLTIKVASTASLKIGGGLGAAAETEATSGRPQVASDILRVGILHEFGGAYMDVGGVTPGTEDYDPSSVEFLGGMDVQPGFHEETGDMENGLMIAKKGSPILREMLVNMEKYYLGDPEKRIKEECGYIDGLYQDVKELTNTKLREELLEYLTVKKQADQMVSKLVKMGRINYYKYMDSNSKDEATEDAAMVMNVMHRWRGYIDHLRKMPLTLLTDKIRPHELESVGTLVSHSINHATMSAFQNAIEGWMQQESSETGADVSEEELRTHWKDQYKGKSFNYGQKGYSWQNPGLSAAEEKERLNKKKKKNTRTVDVGGFDTELPYFNNLEEAGEFYWGAAEAFVIENREYTVIADYDPIENATFLWTRVRYKTID